MTTGVRVNWTELVTWLLESSSSENVIARIQSKSRSWFPYCSSCFARVGYTCNSNTPHSYLFIFMLGNQLHKGNHLFKCSKSSVWIRNFNSQNNPTSTLSVNDLFPHVSSYFYPLSLLPLQLSSLSTFCITSSTNNSDLFHSLSFFLCVLFARI